MHAAKCGLPPIAFIDWVGQFWQIPETRTYMHARSSLAQLLRRKGNSVESVQHFRDLLRLNPQDNQGNRWQLAPALLDAALIDAEYYAELETLLEKYPEPFANLMYTKVLYTFRRNGPSSEAAEALRQAMKKNPFVIDLLLQDPPRTSPKDHFVLGSCEEAQNYVHESWHQWRDTTGAINFIYSTLSADGILNAIAAS